MPVTTKSLGIAAGASLFLVAFALVAHPYQVDALHSSVGFNVPVAGGLSSLQGRFNKFNATIEYDATDATRSSVQATIDVNSLDTGVPARDKHTLGKDGFYASKYPTITFRSKKIVKSGDGFDCLGELNLRGVKRDVSIHFKSTGARSISENQQLVGFAGAFRIDRRDYGMNWQMAHNTDWIGYNADIFLNILARPK